MTKKKRNNNYWKEKTIIRLKMEGDEITQAIRNQGLVELETPIHHGYHAEWVLRSDILRREDAAAYQEALNACKGIIWSKHPDFKYRNRKTKRWEKINPKMHDIKKEQYDSLSPTAKKFFVENTGKERKYWRYGFSDKWYICTLSYELVAKISKHYITHRKEHDNILYQMDAENKKMLYKTSDGHPWTGGGNSKWWNKHENKKIKLQAEREINEIKKVYPNITNKKDLLDL